MSRMISFYILLGILLAIAILFFKVMAGFLLPLFMAVLLVVMFRPLHRWYQQKLPDRPRLAAAATTGTILLIFLVPLLVIFFQATGEAVGIYNKIGSAEFDRTALVEKLDQVNERLGISLSEEKVEAEIIKRVQEWLAPLVLGTTQYLIGTVIGLCVMVIALYYFLVDGPWMISTVMRLSPLDDKYEAQLIEEFERTSRAVVLAAVVSAIVQGILAGFGYYFADLDAVFLLTVLTMLLAMVPFVGAAAVWAPCAVYLLWNGQTGAAILLALYGALIVSMADNVIKPYILHGRSNLHPLLALLSVLGGVKALGPIGIFVGPMAVTFLYTVLMMLHKELDLLGDKVPEKAMAESGAKK